MTFMPVRFRPAVAFKFWLIATSALVPCSIFAPSSALAACTGTSDNTVCAPGLTPPIEYPTGINVGSNHTPINVTLDAGVQVVSPVGSNVPIAVGLDSTNGGPGTGGASIALLAPGVTITTTNTPPNPPADGFTAGLYTLADGDSFVGTTSSPVSGMITVTGGQKTKGIWSQVNSNATGMLEASVIYNGPGITVTGGNNSSDVEACVNGGCGNPGTASGNAIITATGNFKMFGGDSSTGLKANAQGSGTSAVNYNSGTIDVIAGSYSTGIFASAEGSAKVTTLPGTTINVSSTGAAPTGAEAFSDSAAATVTAASTILVNGNLAVPTTNYKSNPTGIRVSSDLSGSASVTYTGPGMTVHGGGGLGIVAVAGSSDASTASGSVTVNASGPILADGSNAIGILADSGTTRNINSSLSTTPITAPVQDITVGPFRPPTSMTGQVEVTASNVSTPGEFGTAISATGGNGGVAVTIPTGGLIMGGWQLNATSVGSTYGLPAAGVVFGSNGGTATLTNNGTIGALSDRAVASADRYQSGFTHGFTGDLNIVNNGTIIGYVTLGSENDTFQNLTPNSFDIRNFADTNGDGIRDTKAVAISDFGAGDDEFINGPEGVVRLLPVAGATTTDPTGYYVPTTGIDSRPLEVSFYDLSREGVVQGQLINLETFSNAGAIDLRNAAVGGAPPVVGNTLLITGGSATAVGAPGTGLYVSNGGKLFLNTVLNDGIPLGGQTNSYSDMLIVDRTQLGTGATTIGVTNVGGDGALTPGNGIELVEVRDKAASDPAAFTLAGDYVTKQGQQAVVGGAYAYTLFHGGVGTDSADGNWYLRSELVPTTSGQTPIVPLYQAGDPIYEIYPQVLLDLNGLPTMQERVGDRYWTEPTAPQEVFCKDPTQNFRCKVSPEQASYYAGGQPAIETNGIWTRIDGFHGHFEPRVTTTGTDYQNNIWQLQAGLDGLLHEAKDGGQLIGGVNLHYGHASASATSIYGDGSIDTNGYGFGGTLTWLAQNGFYVDGQASVTWFDSDLSSDTAGRSLANGNNGFGYALSVESGKRFDLGEAWTITPQAQLAYSNVSFDDFSDPFGARVSSGNSDSLVGRLGVSADKEESWKDDDGKTRRSHFYGITNLYYDFLNASEVDVSGTKLESGPERLWGGVGVGGSYNWNDDKYSVYAEVSANTSLKRFGDSYNVSGTVGLRVKW